MYYLYKVEEKIRVPPNRLSDNLKKVVLELARDEFERKIIKDIGLILAIVNPKIIGEGKIVHDDPGVYYNVSLDLLVFRPEINEVIYGVVKSVVDFGAFVGIGPLEALLHISQIGNEKYSYNKAESILISSNTKRKIKEGTVVLAKVSTVSMKSNVADTKVGITLRAAGLGIKDLSENKKKKVKKE